MKMFELLEDGFYYILKSNTSSLWCSKIDGSLSVQKPDDVMISSSPVCLGIVHGLIGKFRVSSESDWKLLLVKKAHNVGTLPPTNVTCCKIMQILALTLNPCTPFAKDQDIQPCPKHNKPRSDGSKVILTNNLTSVKKPLQKTWNQFINVAENIRPKKLNFKMPSIPNMVLGSGNITSNLFQKDSKEKEKFERKVMEELHRMFNESDSFYFTPDGGDLTNSIQARQYKLNTYPAEDQLSFKSWKLAKNCFFWNMHMLNDLIKLSEHNAMANEWILPIIQGYVQIEECPISFEDDDDDAIRLPSSEEALKLKMCIISRRSRHRTGTRYKRRGIDEDGYTANFVETEQILEFVNHIVSFVQIRGSVPLFWSQTGMKYKPPPKLERDFDQNHKVFSKHLNNLIDRYNDVNIISLIDQTGKEKVIGDAFLQHIVTFNHPNMVYITFDFHDYCRGMKFENIGILTENMMKIIHDMRYCWIDKNGLICEQRGIFRVNCIDCLDRTNIAQSAIARVVLEIQCRKFGLLSPERQLGGNYKSIYQEMWANNGDAISRQYAGTAALKGDYTRTGERKIAGMMRDGVNSANRYYINRVKDMHRQATLDLMQGNAVTWDSLNGNRIDGEEENEFVFQKDEDLKMVIEDCKKLLIIKPEKCLGGWGLVNYERLTGSFINGASELSQMDMDTILLLSKTCIFVASYDDSRDYVTSYQRIALQNITYIELGLAMLVQDCYQLCLRIYYSCDQNVLKNMEHISDQALYFYTFCLPGTKFLNSGESLPKISEGIVSACKIAGKQVKIQESEINCLVKSRPHEVIIISSHAQKMVDNNLPKPPCLSGVSTPINLPFKTFQEKSPQQLINTESTFGTNAYQIIDLDVSGCENISKLHSLEHTFMDHVQKTRKLQLELKQLIHYNFLQNSHICLPSCGILAICSSDQLKLGLIREAESCRDNDTANYSETITLLRQISDNKSNDSARTCFNKTFGHKLMMLSRQTKSKSLDASNMLKRVENFSPEAVLHEREECRTPYIEKSFGEIMSPGQDTSSLITDIEMNEESACDMDKQVSSNSEFGVITETSLLQNLSSTNRNLQALVQMKNSHSENSFITKSASFDLLSDNDDFDFEQSTSLNTLSKFRKKLAQLTVPLYQIDGSVGIATESDLLRKQANSNAVRSQLRFQHMKCKIYLL